MFPNLSSWRLNLNQKEMGSLLKVHKNILTHRLSQTRLCSLPPDGPVDYSRLPESLRYLKRTQGALEWKNSFVETNKLTQMYLKRNFWKSLRRHMPAVPARRPQSIAWSGEHTFIYPEGLKMASIRICSCQKSLFWSRPHAGTKTFESSPSGGLFISNDVCFYKVKDISWAELCYFSCLWCCFEASQISLTRAERSLWQQSVDSVCRALLAILVPKLDANEVQRFEFLFTNRSE